MNIALDLIIVAIIAFNIVYAVKKGFVKIVLRSLTVVVSLILAFMLVAPVRSALSATEYSTKAEAAIRDGVISLLDGIASDGRDDAVSADEQPEEDVSAADDGAGAGMQSVISLLGYAGIDTGELQADMSEWIDTKSEQLKVKLADGITPGIHKALLTAVSFTAIFAAALIVMNILAWLLGKAVKLPVLKQADKLLGLIVGAVLALAEVYLFVALVKLLLPYGAALGGIMSDVSVKDTFLFRFFYSTDLFRLIF